MALLTNSSLHNRPFTLERPLSRHRRAKLTQCGARSDLEIGNSRSGLAGGIGLAAYVASLSRALAEADIDIPPQLTPSGPGPQLPDVNFQLPAEAGGIGQFISDYPLALPLAAALVLVPLLVSQVSGSSGAQGVSAARALTILETEDPVVFVDIRSGADCKSQGSPDLASIKKAAMRLPFTKVSMPGYSHALSTFVSHCTLYDNMLSQCLINDFIARLSAFNVSSMPCRL